MSVGILLFLTSYTPARSCLQVEVVLTNWRAPRQPLHSAPTTCASSAVGACGTTLCCCLLELICQCQVLCFIYPPVLPSFFNFQLFFSFHLFFYFWFLERLQKFYARSGRRLLSLWHAHCGCTSSISMLCVLLGARACLRPHSHSQSQSQS